MDGTSYDALSFHEDMDAEDTQQCFRSVCNKGKGEVPPGCLLTKPVTSVTSFSIPLEPCFGTMPLSSALSQLHILCVSWHLQTPKIISLRCAH